MAAVDSYTIMISLVSKKSWVVLRIVVNPFHPKVSYLPSGSFIICIVFYDSPESVG